MKMKKTFKAMKFHIGDNPVLSETIQKHLFELGYKWQINGQKVQYTYQHGLTAHTDGNITWGSGKTESGFTDIDIEWMKPEKRKTVEVGDKTYYEDELAEALSKIKEVE
jgi:hypothetical protein